MQNFRTFNLAASFYQQSKTLKLTGDARNQLDRASRSIALNLAEGRGKRTRKDQVRFFQIAMGSTRECQAIFILENITDQEAVKTLDILAAHLYRLIQRA